MDCQKCQELLSDYLDGTLEQKEQAVLNSHLNECLSCAEVRNDLREIVGFCQEYRHEYDAVPNQHALWLRISNVVEGERERVSWANRASQAGVKRGWWSELMNRRWALSMPQMAAALAAIMIAVATGTIAGLRLTESQPGSTRVIALGEGGSAIPQPVLTRDYQGSMRRQQAAIDYWNRRVEQRKSRWSPQMREAFDRNMHEIDLSVNDALNGLQQNPHDGLAEEMLDTAISEKMELLKEFSDF